MEIEALALSILFGLRCVLLLLTLGVGYAYAERVVDFLRGHGTEDRLGAAVWLAAIGMGAANIHNSYLMLALPGMFHGSLALAITWIVIITIAHYLALTAWIAFRYDLTPKHVGWRAAALFLSVGMIGGVGYAGYLLRVG